MLTLAEFLTRLCFGLAAGMAATSPRQVGSGYFRNHLYVTLGLATLAGLAISMGAGVSAASVWTAAVGSYVGSACWLYEKPRAGRIMLLIVASAAGVAAWQLAQLRCSANTAASGEYSAAASFLWQVQPVTSGLLLGSTMAAMLLGHWYLNSPGMELAPLRRLLAAILIAAALHATVCGSGLALEIARAGGENSIQWVLFVAMRWLFGLPSVAALVGMAWATLRIPNTQSATGILYVAVIGTFVGETMSLLLSSESAFPL